MQMTRLLDASLSKGLEVVRKLLGHPDFHVGLGRKILQDGGADRAVRALQREFFPVPHENDFPEAGQFQLIADGIISGKVDAARMVHFPNSHDRHAGDGRLSNTVAAIYAFATALASKEITDKNIDVEAYVQDLVAQIRRGSLTKAMLDEFIATL